VGSSAGQHTSHATFEGASAEQGYTSQRLPDNDFSLRSTSSALATRVVAHSWCVGASISCKPSAPIG
jgi:hypothetical protein